MLKAKKSLGQNWLKSESAVKEIVKTADIKAGDLVLEIGPGRGVLTKELLTSSCQVVAVEKDDRLIEELGEKFKEEIKTKKLILIHDDILKLDFSKTLAHEAKPHGNSIPNPNILIPKYKLVANIPYYITGQIIRKFLSVEENQPSLMMLMVQKEVAKRIVASDKKESLLSISVKAYGTPKYIKTVPAGAFEPKPKVDSAILLIGNISRNFFANISEDKFFEILKKGFGQKRKLLRGNLGVGEEVLQACTIPLKARAENLTLENWHCLSEKIS